jgi:hypothetical protein
MTEFDWGWAREQLDSLGVSEKITRGVRALLEAWEDGEIEESDKDRVLELFSQLAKGHAIAVDSTNEVWVPGEAGDFTKTETVRVKADAFEGRVGQIHNGRVGKVVDIRSSDIIFRSTDGKEPFLDGVHYRPTNLERLV